MTIDIAFIKNNEGLKLHSYDDVAGIPTIGYGHKLLHGETFPDGITEQQAGELLEKDLQNINAFLETIPNLTDNQCTALADFA